MVVLDLETCLIEPGKLAPPVVCVTYASVRGGNAGNLYTGLVHARSDAALDILRRVLSEDLIVGVNISFDLGCVLQQWPELSEDIWKAYEEDRVADCMHLAQLSDIATKGKLQRRYSLAAMCERYLGEEVAKGEDTWRLRYGELMEVDVSDWPEEAVRYAVDDVRFTHALWTHLDSVYTRPSSLFHQARSAFALHLATAWGWRTNPQVVHSLKESLEFSQREHREILQDVGFIRANGTLNTKIVQSEAERLGATDKTPTGSIQITASVIKGLDDERFRTLYRWKKGQKLLTTYVPVLERGVREPLHPRYRVCVESGRTSCTGPNIQNLPRDGGIRDAFEARPGRVLVAADYSVAELVCLAQCLYTMYGDNALRRTLMSGDDLHLTTAAMMTGEDAAKLIQRFREGDPEAKRLRQFAKAFSFGIPGGLGRKSLRSYLANYGVELSEDEAAVAREKWLNAYPEVRLLFKDLSKKSRVSSTFRIKHPVTGFARAGCSYTSGANFYFQHLGAFGGKEACYLVQRACFDPTNDLYGARLVAFVHDELIVSCAEDRIDQSASELERLMKLGFQKACPDVPVQVESLAMKRWYKNAKRVEVGGKLQVWSP